MAAVVYVLAYVAWTYFHWGGEANIARISDLAYLPVSLFAAVSAWRVAADRRFDRRLRRAWLILGLSIFTQFIADLIWFYLEIILKVSPYPSAADIFYLSLYPLMLWGLLSFSGAPLSRGDRVKSWLDLSIVIIAAWMVVWYFIISPAAAASQSNFLSQVLAAAYPIGDMVVLGGLVALLFRRPDSATRSALLVFLVGLIVFLGSDLFYAFAGLNGTYASGGWLDVGWIVAYLLFAFAALRQARVSPDVSSEHWSARLLDRLPVLLPFAAIGLGYGLVIFVAIGGEHTSANMVGLFIGAALLTAFVMGRQLLALNENKRLNADLHATSEELRTTSKELEQRVAARTRDLALAAEISRRISALRDLNTLLTETVELIRDRFDLYYAQIYLTDPTGRVLVLRAGTGSVGAELLRRGHRLLVGPGSIHGAAAARRRAISVTDIEAGSLFRSNPLLPETRSEIAVPLMAGDRVVGILDLQSAQPGALSTEHLAAFEALASQLAIAIENAILFADAEQAQAEVEAQARRLTGTGWQEFLNAVERSERLGFTYDQAHLAPLTEPLAPQGGYTLQSPIVVTGEPIGRLQLEAEPSRIWTADDAIVVETVARQVAQQVENLRVLTEAERYRHEADQAVRRQTREGWESRGHSSDAPQNAYAYDLNTVQPLSVEADLDKPDTPTRRVPLAVHGETIGTLAFVTDALTEEANDLAATVAGQLSAHLENLRLAEQTRAGLIEQERLSAGLRTSEAELRSLFAAMPDVVIVFDAQGRYVRIAPTNPSLLYKPPTEMLGKTLGEVLPAAQAEAFLGNIQQVLGTQQTLNIEYALPIGGTDIWFSATLSPLTEDTVFWLARDITERKQAETALAKRATELQTVAQVSTAASTILETHTLLQNVVDLTKESFDLYHAHVYLLDADGHTLTLTAGAGEVGRQMAAAGRSIPLNREQSLVARAARTRAAVIVNDVRAEPGFLPHPLLPNTRAEMAVPIIVGDRVLGVFDVQHDQLNYFTDADVRIQTTLAAQVAVALQNANLFSEQAATVVRLRELDQLKSTFLANMSHELRTPLNSILGFTDVILEGLDGPLTGQMDNDLKVIQRNGRHLLELINDVLDMAKIEAGKMNLTLEHFNLYEVLDEVLELTGPLAREKALEIRVEPSLADGLYVEADRVRLRQVMINLVGNAIKFTEKGGLTFRAAQSEGHIRFAIRDTGLGIPPDKLDSIFEAFSQVDSTTTRKAGGTGLGLPISRRLIELHGGRLWAESAGIPGAEGGSTFFIELPVEAPKEAVR